MLELQVAGPPGGLPVLYFHGTPGSSRERPGDAVLARRGVTFLAFDRPGYGEAPPAHRLTLQGLAEAAIDAVAARGHGRIAVAGWSGGGPYALACGAAAPERVRCVALLSSWAPMGPPAPGLPVPVRAFMRAAQVLPRPALRLALLAAGRRSVGQLDDLRRVSRPWGFTPSEVAASTPVAAWHAEGDAEVPIGPWREEPGVELNRLQGGAHEPVDAVWDDVFRWMASHPSSE